MTYTVWTKDQDGNNRALLCSIPLLGLAEKLVVRVMEVYGDRTAWIEED
ncbi:hypothetical protein ACWDWU_16970 [Streptomyces sp. NPDC003442]